MPTIADYLKYANLQMAAEALYGLVPSLSEPGQIYSGDISPDVLTNGNLHASRFTALQAEEFCNEWEVVEHKSNTATGFSGTLFRNKFTGEQVLSCRSTEFIDDSVRDNQATNALEIKECGWAFGQISDMKAWVDSLYASGKIDNRPLNVTGYSLGGHLATAFNMLYPSLVGSTYTFNGAGVGTTDGGLASVIAYFDKLRKNENGNEITFSDATTNSLYQDLRQIFNGTADYSSIDALMNQAATKINQKFAANKVNFREGKLTFLPGLSPDIEEMVAAINRVATITYEGVRLASLTDPNGDPAQIAAQHVDAVKLLIRHRFVELTIPQAA